MRCYMILNKADTKRVLKEFHRWQNVSGMLDLVYTNDYMIEITEPPKHLSEYQDWRAESGKQVNRVKQAVNAIDDKRLRQLLINRYLIRRIARASDLIAEMGLKKSRYYELHSEAIAYFSKVYREW